ncbi:MAG: DUF3224 domain-containing protein [Myxococcales bacterium]
MNAASVGDAVYHHGMPSAAGTFAVTMNPEPPYDVNEGASIGRVSIKKQFSGDLEAVSSVEMIGARSEVKGSAGYVAIERVSGVLHGRSGTFVLQHSGTMTRGKGELSVTVVPDSGTGELKGLAGRMTIEIVEGKHLYGFEYTFDAP